MYSDIEDARNKGIGGRKREEKRPTIDVAETRMVPARMDHGKAPEDDAGKPSSSERATYMRSGTRENSYNSSLDMPLSETGGA